MRGIILAIAPGGTYGQLTGEDGKRYSYWTSEISNGSGQIGRSFDFQLWEGQPIDISVLASVAPSRAAPPQHPGAPQPAAYGAAVPAYATISSPYEAAAAVIRSLDYWIKLFTSPAGRISRRQFWLHGVLPIIVCSVVLAWIPVLGALVTLALTWAWICVCFKRFYDLGYPGWWSLLNIVPMLLAAFLIGASFFVTGFGIAWLLAELVWGLALIFWIVQMALVYLHVGQQGPNEYGRDPLAGA
jgi:uncharacterized membrane protein YhaH (DUF805 family)